MKKYIYILFPIFLFSCKSQIIPQNNAYVNIPEGAYIKDTENFLDKFVGTWKYQNGNETFTITFTKVLHYHYSNWYEDILIGEYQYIDSNGTTIVNSLPNLTNSNITPLHHNIVGAISLVRLQYPACPECDNGEYRIKSYFYDPDRKYQNLAIVLRSITDTQIIVKLFREGKSTFFNTDINAPDDLRIPAADYVMNKI